MGIVNMIWLEMINLKKILCLERLFKWPLGEKATIWKRLSEI